MKEIGGYFEFEFSRNEPFLHENGVLLNTGRNAIEYVLRTIPKIACVYVPYCTCHTVMQPIETLGLKYVKYHINDRFEIQEDIQLNSDEYIIYTNYYGMMDEYIRTLNCKFEDRLIIDSAQGFFSPENLCKKIIFTPHKFAGITNGAIAFSDYPYIGEPIETDIAFRRTSHMFARYDGPAIMAYDDYKTNMRQSRNQPIQKMSNLTFRMCRNLDFDAIAKKRLINVNYIHSNLHDSNLLKVDLYEKPLLAYPYWTKDSNLRSALQAANIFCPTYWPNVMEWCSPDDMDYILSKEIIPIPIDQRYGQAEMEYILSVIRAVKS
jgi:hypothetical protein